MAALTKNLSTKRVFNYSKGGVSLNFELNEDVKMVSDFKKCLQEALKDVKKALEELPKK
jgi:hypothetical protein